MGLCFVTPAVSLFYGYVARPAWQPKGHHAPPWTSHPLAQASSPWREEVVCRGIVDGLGGHAV
jgi:hypothetical protein